MPASEAKCKELVKRLRSLRFSGSADDANGTREEVGRTLMRAAESDAHAEEIVRHLLRNCKEFPVPSEIWTAAENVEAPLNLRAAAPSCTRCSGTGFEPGQDAKGRRVVAPCRCRRVQAGAA